MRRATIAEVPSKYSLSAEGGRSTLVEDPRRRQRNVRDKAHQAQCVSEILDFLARKEYDLPVSVSSLSNPSLKEFQSIFRFIHSFISPPFDSGKRFEDEVVAFLRGIKYPYASEINRSQLIAITPHTLPAILAMLSWLISLINTLESEGDCSDASPEDEVKSVFYKYLYNEYALYMEGAEETENGAKAVETATKEMYKERAKTMNELQMHLEKIEADILHLGNAEKERSELEEKRRQGCIDIEKLLKIKQHSEETREKCKRSLEEALRTLENMRGELANLYKKKSELEEEISLQPIKPEDIAEMTEERDALIKAMEGAKKTKTFLIREIEALNQKIRVVVEDTDKLLFELHSIAPFLEISLRIKKTKISSGLLDYDEYTIKGEIDGEHEKAKRIFNQLANTVSEVEERLHVEKERNQILQEQVKSLQEEIVQKKERVKVHAQVYVEKKEASEEEYRRAVGRVDKAETELLKILADGDNGYFQSEQNLERLRIKRGRVMSQIDVEEAEMQRVISLVTANIESLKERVKDAYISLNSTSV